MLRGSPALPAQSRGLTFVTWLISVPQCELGSTCSILQMGVLKLRA